MIIAGNHRTKTPGIAVAALIADTTKSDGECELRIWEGAGQAHSAAACVIPDVAETVGLLRLLAGSGTAGASAKIVRGYARGYSDDFEQRRQLEARFEIPLRDSVLVGAIDLLVHLDGEGRIIGANVIDFQTIEGGPDPERNTDIDWPELTRQLADQVSQQSLGGR